MTREDWGETERSGGGFFFYNSPDDYYYYYGRKNLRKNERKTRLFFLFAFYSITLRIIVGLQVDVKVL